MTRALVQPQEVTRSPLAPTFANGTATDGDSFPNDGRTLLRVKNTGAQVTLTIPQVPTLDGVATAGKTFTIPATTGDVTFGPFPPAIYNQADGTVHLDWSAVTGLSFAPLHVGSL